MNNSYCQPPENLVHYTKLPVLHNILGHSSKRNTDHLRMYSAASQSDPNEGKEFFRSIRKGIAEEKIIIEEIGGNKVRIVIGEEEGTYKIPKKIQAGVKNILGKTLMIALLGEIASNEDIEFRKDLEDGIKEIEIDKKRKVEFYFALEELQEDKPDITREAKINRIDESFSEFEYKDFLEILKLIIKILEPHKNMRAESYYMMYEKFIDYLEKYSETKPNSGENIQEDKEVSDTDNYIQNHFKDILDMVIKQDLGKDFNLQYAPFNTFLVCFVGGSSSVMDKRDFWIEYGDLGSGGSLKIPNDIFNDITTANSKNCFWKKENEAFGKVSYNFVEWLNNADIKIQQDIRGKFMKYSIARQKSEEMLRYGREYSSKMALTRFVEIEKFSFIKRTISDFELYRYFHKSPDYKWEKEWRFVKIESDFKEINFDYSSSKLRRYILDTRLQGNKILGKGSKITFGPRSFLNSDLKKFDLQLKEIRKKKSLDFEIKKSTEFEEIPLSKVLYKYLVKNQGSDSYVETVYELCKERIGLLHRYYHLGVKQDKEDKEIDSEAIERLYSEFMIMVMQTESFKKFVYKPIAKGVNSKDASFLAYPLIVSEIVSSLDTKRYCSQIRYFLRQGPQIWTGK